MLSASNSTLKAIRSSAKELAIPKPYHPVYSTLRGVGNIISGVSQCLVGTGMKCSKTYQGNQSKTHLERGWKALNQGVTDTLPAATVAAVVGSAISIVGTTAVAIIAVSAGAGYAIHKAVTKKNDQKCDTNPHFRLLL